MRTLTIYYLSNFQVSNTILLTRITMLYIRFPDFIHFITDSLYPLTNFSPFLSLTKSLATTILLSGSMSSTFLESTFKQEHTIFMFLCLAYFTQFLESVGLYVLPDLVLRFSATFFFKPILFLFSFWDSDDVDIRFFVIFPQVPEESFIFPLLFSLLFRLYYLLVHWFFPLPPPLCCEPIHWAFFFFLSLYFLVLKYPLVLLYIFFFFLRFFFFFPKAFRSFICFTLLMITHWHFCWPWMP